MRDKLKFIIVPRLLKWSMQLIGLTCRMRWHNREALEQYVDNQQPFVLGMWHNCSTICGWVMRDQGMSVMISDSRDGEYIARLCTLFGNKTIRGSSSKGSLKAMYKAIKLLYKNEPIAITPDGPRGPRYKLQGGILWLAAAGKAPVLPLHIESSRQWVLNTWDKQCIPKPFSTIHASFGTPMMVEQSEFDENLFELTQRVEDRMMENTHFVEAQINAN